MKLQLKKDKGTAGLTILLSVVVMLFVIGLLVVIFVIMGNQLRESTFTAVSGTVTNESGFYLNGTTFTVDYATAENFRSFDVTALHNASNGAVIGLGNITEGATGTIVNATATWVSTYEVNASYTYTWDTDNSGTSVMKNTTDAIAGTSDWFDIFIVITAMVVLILLTVIIITAIRSSGLAQVGGSSGAGKVGTA